MYLDKSVQRGGSHVPRQISAAWRAHMYLDRSCPGSQVDRSVRGGLTCTSTDQTDSAAWGHTSTCTCRGSEVTCTIDDRAVQRGGSMYPRQNHCSVRGHMYLDRSIAAWRLTCTSTESVQREGLTCTSTDQCSVEGSHYFDRSVQAWSSHVPSTDQCSVGAHN